MKQVQKQKRVAIVGARGYSGLELARLLLKHPEAELVACFAHDQLFSLGDYLPEEKAKDIPVVPLIQLRAFLPSLDCVFLATPAEASRAIAAEILAEEQSSASVIDLSGAFRFQAGSEAERNAKFQLWYQSRAVSSCALSARSSFALSASYGLVPFAQPAKTPKALIANPGCYATAVLMAVIPLLKSNTLVADSIVIDAKSGTTGAGRKAAEGQLFAEVDGECLPYKVGQHQHLPEIEEWAEAYSGTKISPFFTTHLLPVRRGIIAGIYARLAPGIGAEEVGEALTSAYSNYPLVKVTELDGDGTGFSPKLALSLKRVTGTARVHLSYKVVGEKLYLFSVIDNLLKGAASQAVENFNRLHDYPAALGLDMEGVL